jgi:hypothetical protein
MADDEFSKAVPRIPALLLETAWRTPQKLLSTCGGGKRIEIQGLS